MAITEIQKGQTDWHLPINENFKALEAMIEKISLLMHPVGFIYMSAENTNPSTFFGGTWISWGSGCVPVGVDITDADFNTVEKTGGEKTHVLTEAEVAPHFHLETVYWNGGGTGAAYPAAIETANPNKYGGVVARTESAGGGQAHNNLQPYITCYMWKRIA